MVFWLSINLMTTFLTRVRKTKTLRKTDVTGLQHVDLI